MALVWVSLSGVYTYKGVNGYLLGINVFPLALWTFGLLAVRRIYDAQEGKYRFIKLSIIYVIVLLCIEAVGYHFLQIQLDSQFTGVFGLDVLHVPLYAKVWYLSAGPLFVALTKRLDDMFKWR